MKRLIQEFKIGGIVYSDEGAYLPIFHDGLKRAFDTLVYVAEQCRNLREVAADEGKIKDLQGEDVSKFSDLMQVRDQLMETIQSGMTMMSQGIINDSATGDDLVDMANRFNAGVLRLVERFRGSTTREVSPTFDYIPGVGQGMDYNDSSRFNAGIFRKQSDHALSPSFMKVLTQDMDTPKEGSLLFESVKVMRNKNDKT